MKVITEIQEGTPEELARYSELKSQSKKEKESKIMYDGREVEEEKKNIFRKKAKELQEKSLPAKRRWKPWKKTESKSLECLPQYYDPNFFNEVEKFCKYRRRSCYGVLSQLYKVRFKNLNSKYNPGI